VKARRVVAVDDDVASRWGPRIVDFARAVAAAARK
jgi:iron complex transport system substrate-binding protein